MPTASNRRRFTRLPFDAFATLETSSGRYRAQVLDLSLHGALLLTPDGFEPRVGDEATIEISLSDEAHISMPVRLRHSEEGLLGCELHHIDMDSLSHLRRLLELNLGDAELVERELSQLLDQVPTSDT